METSLQILLLKLQIHTYGWDYFTPLSLGKECQCARINAFAQYPLANFERTDQICTLGAGWYFLQMFHAKFNSIFVTQLG